MVTFQLSTPVAVGPLSASVTVSALRVTAVSFSTTPALAPLGTAELSVTLTDPVSGWQEMIQYRDATVLTFFAQSAPTPTTGQTVEDVMSQLVFAKLVADGKLPAGSIAQA